MSISVIGVHQILKGEEGFVDLSKPAQPEPVRVPVKPSTPEEDQVILNSVATFVESLLKELKRRPAPERIAEIDNLLRAKIPGLLGQVVAARRLKTGLDRHHADAAVSVQEARRHYLSVGPADHNQLVILATEALELFKTECQNAQIS